MVVVGWSQVPTLPTCCAKSRGHIRDEMAGWGGMALFCFDTRACCLPPRTNERPMYALLVPGRWCPGQLAS